MRHKLFRVPDQLKMILLSLISLSDTMYSIFWIYGTYYGVRTKFMLSSCGDEQSLAQPHLVGDPPRI